MTVTVPAALFDFLSPVELRRLRIWLRQSPRQIQTSTVIRPVGVDIDAAMAVVMILGDHVGKKMLMVYDSCDDLPVMERPFEQGFPTLPIECPECGDLITAEHISYDVRADLPPSVLVVDDSS